MRTSPIANALGLLSVFLLLSASCSGKESDKGGNEKPVEKDAAVVSAKKDAGVTRDASGPPEVPRIPKEFVTVGIPACDDYITKQRTCLEEHAPEGIRKPQLIGLRAIAAKWKEAAESRKTQLEKTCSHMLASSKAATSAAWGCKW